MNNSKSKVLVQDHIKTESNMKTKIDSKSPIKDDLNLANIKKKKKINYSRSENSEHK